MSAVPTNPLAKAAPRLRSVYSKRLKLETIAAKVRASKWAAPMPAAWLADLARICRGSVQPVLLLTIHRYSAGAEHNLKKKEKPPKWSHFRLPEDLAAELGVSADAIRDAIDDAVARGLIARMSQSQDATGDPHELHRYRLTPENWATTTSVFVDRNRVGTNKVVPISWGEEEANSHRLAIRRDQAVRVEPGKQIVADEGEKIQAVMVEGEAPPIIARLIDGVVTLACRYVSPTRTAGRTTTPPPPNSIAARLAEIGLFIDHVMERKIVANLGQCPVEAFVAYVASRAKNYDVRTGLLPDLALQACRREAHFAAVRDREHLAAAEAREAMRSAYRRELAKPNLSDDDRALVLECLAQLDREAQS
jgi:hypothetical protein